MCEVVVHFEVVYVYMRVTLNQLSAVHLRMKRKLCSRPPHMSDEGLHGEGYK